MSTASPTHTDSALPRAEHPSLRHGRRWLALTRGNLPNLIVFSLLAGVFLLGHQTGWKLPSLSALTGGTPEAPADWCAEHLVPEASCVECVAGLMPPSSIIYLLRQARWRCAPASCCAFDAAPSGCGLLSLDLNASTGSRLARGRILLCLSA